MIKKSTLQEMAACYGAVQSLADLQNVTTQQAEATAHIILGADFAELERRVVAWHAEVCENLRAQGYRPTGDGPLSDA